jgi:ribonucleotide reductase alpha subunit
MATQKQRTAARKNIKKAAKGGKTKTNFKTLAEENATSARTTGRQSQTITTLILK